MRYCGIFPWIPGHWSTSGYMYTDGRQNRFNNYRNVAPIVYIGGIYITRRSIYPSYNDVYVTPVLDSFYNHCAFITNTQATIISILWPDAMVMSLLMTRREVFTLNWSKTAPPVFTMYNIYIICVFKIILWIQSRCWNISCALTCHLYMSAITMESARLIDTVKPQNNDGFIERWVHSYRGLQTSSIWQHPIHPIDTSTLIGPWYTFKVICMFLTYKFLQTSVMFLWIKLNWKIKWKNIYISSPAYDVQKYITLNPQHDNIMI